MKKIVAALLVATLTMALASCSDSTLDELQQPSLVEPGNQTDENQDNTNTNADTQQGSAEGNTKAVQIQETVLLDEAGVKITATSLDESSLFGPEVKLTIENNSEKNLTFQCAHASVNGYMAETIMSVDVVSGKKAVDTLTLSDTYFDICGISEISEIEVSFHIFDADTWDTFMDTEPVQITTNVADSYVQIHDDSGYLAYEGNDVKIVIKGLSEDASLFGPSLIAYIENTGSRDVTVQVRDISINDFMVVAFFSCDVTAGKRAVDMITFDGTDLKESNIENIEDIEMSFYIFDADKWETIADTEPTKITF